MILQVLQVTLLDIATHRIGNPVSLLTADLGENENSRTSTARNVLQAKVSGKYQHYRVLYIFYCGQFQRRFVIVVLRTSIGQYLMHTQIPKGSIYLL